MINFLIAFIVFLLWSFFGLWIYSLIQPSKIAVNSDTTYVKKNTILESSKEKISVILQEEDSIAEVINIKDTISENIHVNYNTLKIIDEKGNLLFLFPEGISITKNSPELLIPKTLIDFKSKLNTYIIDHSKIELHVISLYSPIENIESPNIGMQRGLKIKDILVSTGISAEKIVVKPIIKDIQFNENQQFNNSLTFVFKPINLKRIEDLKLKKPNTKIVYPKFSESEF